MLDLIRVEALALAQQFQRCHLGPGVHPSRDRVAILIVAGDLDELAEIAHADVGQLAEDICGGQGVGVEQLVDTCEDMRSMAELIAEIVGIRGDVAGKANGLGLVESRLTDIGFDVPLLFRREHWLLFGTHTEAR